MRYIFLLLISLNLYSFDITENLKGWGVIDIYYGYDFNTPDDHIRQPFFYQYNRHNEVNLNMGLIGLDYNDGKIRGNLTLQAGTYAQDNYSSEESMLKNIFEAYLGTRLNNSGTAWIDAGIFGSHLGFESAINHENPVLTRSFSSESSPYFLSGARLNWNVTEDFLFHFVVANGWQRISRQLGNQLPGLGLQVQYTPGNLTFNYSNFLFNDDEFADADGIYNRLFHNLYAKYEDENLYLLGGFDIGFDMDNTIEDSYWYIASIVAGYKLDSNWQVSARGERISDRNNYVIPVTSHSSNVAGLPVPLELLNFQTYAFSVGVDRIIGNGLFIRSELRLLNGLNQDFEASDDLFDESVSFMLSISKTFK